MVDSLMPQPAETEMSEAESEIARLESIGIPRDKAILMKEGVLRVETDPTTREAFLVNIADGTSQPLSAPQAERIAAEIPEATDPTLSFGGPRFEGGEGAFGVGGFSRNIANTVSDTVGMGQIFPEAGSAIADYRVMGEGLLNRISSAYNRQPPSWLMQSIRENIPNPARPLQGPEDALNKLNALGRDFAAEEQILLQRLNEPLSPPDRARLSQQLTAVRSGLAQIQGAIQGIEGGDAGGNTTSSGVKWSIVE